MLDVSDLVLSISCFSHQPVLSNRVSGRMKDREGEEIREGVGGKTEGEREVKGKGRGNEKKEEREVREGEKIEGKQGRKGEGKGE